MSPFISVITVSYNSLAGLRATNESLRRALDFGWETILIDGLSTDGTAEFIGSSECQYRVRVREKDSGIYDAMNKGIRAAQGRFLLFMNCGDRLHEDLELDSVARKLESEGSILVGNCLTDSGHLVSIDSNAFKLWNFSKFAFPHQATFIPKQEFGRLGLYDTEFRIAADQEWFLRAMKNGAKFSSLGATVARYEGGGASELAANRSRVARERRRLLVRHLGWPWYWTMRVIRAFELDEWTSKILNRLRKLR